MDRQDHWQTTSENHEAIIRLVHKEHIKKSLPQTTVNLQKKLLDVILSDPACLVIDGSLVVHSRVFARNVVTSFDTHRIRDASEHFCREIIMSTAISLRSFGMGFMIWTPDIYTEGHALYAPNPHQWFFRCTEDANSRINTCLAESDYKGVITNLKLLVSDVNWRETITMRSFGERLTADDNIYGTPLLAHPMGYNDRHLRQRYLRGLVV